MGTKMKYRFGFVSNSSSSSFVCEVCNEAIELYDADELEEYGFHECDKGHVLCEGHWKGMPFKDWREELEWAANYLEETGGKQETIEAIKNVSEWRDYYRNWWSRINEMYGQYSKAHGKSECPICRLDVITDSALVRFMCKAQGEDVNTVKNAVRSMFENNEELWRWIGR